MKSGRIKIVSSEIVIDQENERKKALEVVSYNEENVFNAVRLVMNWTLTIQWQSKTSAE